MNHDCINCFIVVIKCKYIIKTKTPILKNPSYTTTIELAHSRIKIVGQIIRGA